MRRLGKRLGLLLLPSVVVLGMIGFIFGVTPAIATPPSSSPPPVTNADYAGTPPFISSVVVPNVLIMLDNSGSMGWRAVCDSSINYITSPPSGYTFYNTPVDTSPSAFNSGGCPTSPQMYPSGTQDGAPFVETVTFPGPYDSLACYTYDTTNNRFVPTFNTDGSVQEKSPLVVQTPCATTQWDGNFLNWANFRRHDALVTALIGAQCAATRLSDASCPPSGSPALITMKGVDAQLSSCCDNDSTFPIQPGACAATLSAVYPLTPSCANGRIPVAVQALVTTPCPTCNIVIHLIGATSGSLVTGGFCIGRDDTGQPSSMCGINGTGVGAGEFMNHAAVATEPQGVIQLLGSYARFGLLEFQNSGSGGKVLVPIGWTVATTYSSTSVTAYNTNLQAMVGGIESTAASTGTPLAETLYTGIRYIAQLPQPYSSTSYAYPCAFSGCGPSFPSSSQTAGSLGKITSPSSANEPSQLASGDNCVSGLGYLAGACGRDPYYFGSNPSWASPSAQIACCRSYIMFLTDGEANLDSNIPTAIQDYAHVAHGPHCAGSWAGPPTSNPTSTQYLATTTCFDSNINTIASSVLLLKHKVDYDTPGQLSPASVNHTVDDVAYWGHVNDLRQATIPVTGEAGHDLPGFQNVTVYPMFAFGNIAGRELLMQAAKQGGFNDQDHDGLGPGGVNSPNLQSEWDQVDNVTGLLVPDGIPDTYFESNNAFQIRDKLLAALTSILQRATAGDSVSVLATASTGEGAIFQSYFFPTTFVNIGSTTNLVQWTGYAQALFLDKFGNLREDYSASGCTGPPDGQLVLTHDCIVKFRLETNPASPNFNSVVVDRFKDDGTASGSTAGDGIADTTTPFQTVVLSNGGVSNLQPIWEGGRRLALLSPGTTCEGSTTWPIVGTMSQGGNTCRRILTWADLDNGGSVGGGAGTETLEFSTANAFTLCPYLGGKAVLYCNGDNVAAITAPNITTDPNLTGCLGITRRACAQNEATNIINWIRGSSVTGLRDRTFNVVNDAGAIVQAQWKLGDVMNATAVVARAPSERFDVIYGDATYEQFFQQYKDRREVVYVGANDGMLHAFNAGFFEVDQSQINGTGPTVEVRFTTTPKLKGTSTNCSGLPCDAAVTQYAFRSDAPPLGTELWAFIPQDLLPQLRWLTVSQYSHVYYVDLTPKVTDARIFAADADHPGGWGTILIGGFRLGGSCTACTSGKGTPRVVQADFNYNGTTTDTGDGASGQNSDYRVFLSSYFVLDITNPEKEPKLLWVFRDTNLGLTTAVPAVMRVNPSTDAKTSSTNEKWYAVFGSGPTHHDGFSTQDAQVYVVDLKLGPSYTDINNSSASSHGKGKKSGIPCKTATPCTNVDTSATNGATWQYDTGITNAFMGDAVTLDFNLDFRVDVIYAGSVICNGGTDATGCKGNNPVWTGSVWRLTTNGGNTNPGTWGITSGGSQVPTALISTLATTPCTSASASFTGGKPCSVGPIAAAPAPTSDDTHNIWLFFGTGRFYAQSDKGNVDIQQFWGVKDAILTGGTSSTCTNQSTSPQCNNLFNSSNVVTCSSCASGGNVSTTGSTSSFTTAFSGVTGSLVNNVQNMDGWFTTFNDPTAPLQTPPRSAMTLGERDLSSPTLVGGTVFFTTFIPNNNICSGTGTGQLYAVYYLTGGPYTGSAIGTVTSGTNTLVSKSMSLGQGLPSQMAIQIGAQGTGASGSSSSSGCAGRLTGYIQASTGVLGQTCGSSALPMWSRMVAWRDL